MTLGDAKEHLKQCGESGGIRPGRSLWATAARGARLEQLMRWQHHSFPTLWPRNTSNSPTCVLKSSIKDFRGIDENQAYSDSGLCASIALQMPLVSTDTFREFPVQKAQKPVEVFDELRRIGDALKITRNARARSQKTLCAHGRVTGAGIW